MVREIPDYEDSGDSLERDDGRDLGEMPKSMMIQVTQSDQEEGEEEEVAEKTTRYGVRNLEMSIRFSLKSRPSERFHRPEMSQIKAEISLRANVKLIFHKNVGLQ